MMANTIVSAKWTSIRFGLAVRRRRGKSVSLCRALAGLKAAINGGPAPYGQMRWTQRCQNRCGEPPFLQ
jgi:hypothetical protein